METTIGLIRHGITYWNMEKKIQGIRDIPLNATGIRQAELLAQRLKDEPWDVICSSDLSRAKESAAIIASHMNKEIDVIDERIRERSFGELEGTTEEERIRDWGSNWRELELGVERDEAVYARAMSFLHDVVAQYEGKRILVVSHGAWIVRVLNGLFPNMDYGWIGNTSLSILKYSEGEWKPHHLNCMAHLEEL